MQSARPLDEAATRRGLVVLLVNVFFMWAGFFMVVPLISVHYVDRLGWAATSIGIVLAVRQFTQQGLTTFSGALADRIGPKPLICAGLLVRGIGFASIAWADTFPLLLLSAVLAALGGSMFESPRAAAMAALTDETNRNRFYSLSGVISGIGVTVGIQAGVLLLGLDFDLVALAAASCYVVNLVATILFLPPVRVAAEGNRLTEGIGLALRDRPFMLFNLLLIGYWFLWVQYTISLPLVAKEISGTADAVGWIYAVNSGMTILLQYPLARFAERRLAPMLTLSLGVALMAFGLGAVGLSGTIQALLLCVVLLTGGMLLAQPSQQTVTAGLANPAAFGSYFGVNSLALAVGGSLGNYSGGLLYDLGKALQAPALPWVVFCLVGLLSAAGLWVMYVKRRAVQARGIELAAMPRD
jgi:DHA1 family multidrug resistance protein-like MFS transporter